jgi:hypothetical protein
MWAIIILIMDARPEVIVDFSERQVRILPNWRLGWQLRLSTTGTLLADMWWNVRHDSAYSHCNGRWCLLAWSLMYFGKLDALSAGRLPNMR